MFALCMQSGLCRCVHNAPPCTVDDVARWCDMVIDFFVSDRVRCASCAFSCRCLVLVCEASLKVRPHAECDPLESCSRECGSSGEDR